MVYEGIQKLCFACGRIGHKKDDFPYIIRSSTPPVRGGNDEHGDSTRSRKMHGMDGIVSGGGMSEGSGTATNNNLYRPWMLVTRKKVGQHGARNSTALEGHTGSGRSVLHQGSGQGISMKPTTMGWAKVTNSLKLVNSEPSIKASQLGPFCVGTNLDGPEPTSHFSPSVRGKKGIVRSRTH